VAGIEQGMRLAGRYLLLERLGDGGHGEVWAAEDEVAGTRIALKFMHLGSCSAEDAMLVLRHEAQMVRRLDHAGVLHVDEPLRDGPLVFLPMEYAGGGDVSQLRGASWRLVLTVLLQVARVLEHAHSRGVVHRDIKPANVLFDSSGIVRLTDFGTATRVGSARAMSAGSPSYASPQQLRGEAATTSDDVFGLGALAYALLTCHPPRSNEHRLPVPVHPAPEGLLSLIHDMLAPDGDARPDIGQIMDGFERLLQSAAPGLPVRFERARRMRTWLAAAAIAMALLLLTKGMSGYRVHRDADDRDRGAMLESAERWSEAITHYRGVLGRDAAVQFAQDGLARSLRRMALDEDLVRQLARPELLLADAGARAAALRTLARAEATIPRATRLADQIGRLRAALRLDIICPTGKQWPDPGCRAVNR
jgi:serine/threonine protein kinase